MELVQKWHRVTIGIGREEQSKNAVSCHRRSLETLQVIIYLRLGRKQNKNSLMMNSTDSPTFSYK